MFESNVNYDLGKTVSYIPSVILWFESNVNYDLGKTIRKGDQCHVKFESNVNYDLGKTDGDRTYSDTVV